MMKHELFVAGVNHRTAPVQLREQFAVSAAQLPELLHRLRSGAGLRETVVVSTCNRFEIYGVGPVPASDPARFLRQFSGAALKEPFVSSPPEWSHEAFFLHQGEACVRHLFRVASSLDSLVVGETEIVGQVKTAYLTAQAQGATGPLLNRLLQKALSVSKSVRSQSAIGRSSTSVSAIAVEVASRIFGEDLRERTVLIIGAGKISESTLRHLAKRGARSVLVSNRSYDRACELADRFEAQAFNLEALPDLLVRADIVVSSTSAPGYVLTQGEVARAARLRGHRPLLFVDLAVPRDVDPAVEALPGVFLYNVDQLAEAARQNRAFREAEASACEEVVARHAAEFSRRLANAPRSSALKNLIPFLDSPVEKHLHPACQGWNGQLSTAH